MFTSIKKVFNFVSFYVSNCLSTFYHKETNVRKSWHVYYNDTGYHYLGIKKKIEEKSAKEKVANSPSVNKLEFQVQ